MGTSLADKCQTTDPRPDGVVCRIRPPSCWSGVDARELWQFWELMWVLAGRDLKLRYRQTVLGAAWVVLQPMISAGIFAFVFGAVARLPSGGYPYFLFSLVGLMAWRLFSTTLTQSGLSLLDNADLITKIYFPRFILPLSTVLAAMADFCLSLAVLAPFFAAYGVRPGCAALLLPAWAGVLLMLALGGGLICSALIVRYRDVKHVMGFTTQMLLYASPVAYAVSAVPGPLRAYCYLNPLSAPMEAFRWSLLGTSPPPTSALVASATEAAAALAFGVIWFHRLERTFADAI